MPGPSHVPPGRAGRLWLQRRTSTARHGRDQLERKLRVLAPEVERCRLRVDTRRRQWEEAHREASTWLLRVGVVGGQEAVAHAAGAQPAQVQILWTTTVGVAQPVDARLLDATRDEPDTVRTEDNAAVAPAVAACRAALLAGAQLAAAEEALRRTEAEAVTVRRRLRALDERWLPWLTERLAAVDAALEQAEQEEAVRLRRAAGREAGP